MTDADRSRDDLAAAHRRAHGQASYDVRVEHGPTGAAAAVADLGAGDVAVVVDVLSFTTTLTVAVERGVGVLPFAWRDERAAAYAAEQGAVLAVGRFEARERPGLPSLSPAAMAALDAAEVERVVLPSPNGSTICTLLAGTGVDVVAACLRNASATAAALAERVRTGSRVVVVAAGERWPDGSLRPAWEDVVGVGAVVAGLLAAVPGGAASPEAMLAAAAWAAVDDLPSALAVCAGGRELAASGFAEDVAVAAEHDVSDVVPVLVDGVFSPKG
ncbi:MAG: 2-phosphosulfolactate phosphatase [Nocardioides sp.]|nr:2-phosphosulfolactate phosphatase [Nocardioides sp.]